MKALLVSLFLVTVSFSTYAQFSQTDLTGQWKVKQILEKPPGEEFEPLVKGFKTATFFFNEDNSFKLNTLTSNEIFEEIRKMTNNTKWKFDSENQLIRIGNQEDNFSIMGIYPSKNNSVITFNLDETGILLEMSKIK
jgi:hypothetical protein